MDLLALILQLAHALVYRCNPPHISTCSCLRGDTDLAWFCWAGEEGLLFEDGGGDHLVEGVVFALGGRGDVHQAGAYAVLLEASLQQPRHLRLLKEGEGLRPG